MKEISVFKNKRKAEDAEVVIIPISWALKTEKQFQNAPLKILEASNSIELFHEFYGYQKKCTIGSDHLSPSVEDWQHSLEKALSVNETAKKNNAELQSVVQLIQEDYKKVSSIVEEKMDFWLNKDKLPIILGGDGSVGLGALRGTAQMRSSFGVFHFGDSPCLKKEFNHLNCTEESVLFNAGISVPEINRIVSVGMSNISQPEFSTQHENREKIIWFSNRKIQNYKIKGDTFSKIAGRIINNLPEFVHVSFHANVFKNITFAEIEYLLQVLIDSRRKIVGIDISGFTVNSEEEGKKAAEFLYLISKCFGRSRGK